MSFFSFSYGSRCQSFEAFSEDPYLSGCIAAAYVEGLQQGGVGAVMKHFGQSHLTISLACYVPDTGTLRKDR